jgi:hypothetical protein
MQDFRVKFIKNVVRRSWSQISKPAQELQVAQGPNREGRNSKDLDIKGWSLHDKEPYPKRRETNAKGPHAEGWRFQKTWEASLTKEAANRVGVGLGRSAQVIPGPIRYPLWPRQPSDYL